jgi:hypothetical protein
MRWWFDDAQAMHRPPARVRKLYRCYFAGLFGRIDGSEARALAIAAATRIIGPK